MPTSTPTCGVPSLLSTIARIRPAAAGHPELDAGWDFDFEDQEEMRRRLPALTALCWLDG